MPKGTYIIFEGMDGSGKSTLMAAVANKLSELNKSVIQTKHPGSTKLGQHLRQLVKNPASINPDIVVDDFTRQLLYLADTSSFLKLILEPSLAEGRIVLADRSSFVSAIMYSMADGLPFKDAGGITSILSPPRADRLYILRCPVDVAMQRARVRSIETDHYDSKPESFFAKLHALYDSILTDPLIASAISRAVALDNVTYVDTSSNIDSILNIIIEDILSIISENESL